MEFNDWLATITDEGTGYISRKAGIPKRTLQHQIAHDKPSVENIIAIADAYGRSPVSALIDLDHIDAAWAHVPDVVAALRLASDEQLTDEILRRMQAGSKAYDEPIDVVAARRSNRPQAAGSSTFDMPIGAVADSSDRHEEENSEFDD